jgi:DNA-binding winged helix-turn-helix (wHTH) protein/Flp pilus assembly protein TadD/TolB-like protein
MIDLRAMVGVLFTMPFTESSSAQDRAAFPDGPSAVPSASVIYEFDLFRLDPANRRLMSSGVEVPLPGRAFDLLLMLVRRPGALLTKEELVTTLWNGAFVEESNLAVAASTLRRALREDPHDRRYIQTVARRGYRFVAEVRETQEIARAAVSSYAPRLSRKMYDVAGLPASDGIAASDIEEVDRRVSAQLVVPNLRSPLAVAQSLARTWSIAIIAGVLLSILTVGGWLWLTSREPVRTLAVLPFTLDASSARGATPEFLSVFGLLGMTDGMISRLDGQLVVRPTSSVLLYSGTGPVDPASAGREQGVDAVLTGLLDDSSGRTNLKLRLIRVRDGVTLWQDSFRTASNDLSQLEQDAGNAAARELRNLGPRSEPSQTALRTAYPVDAVRPHAKEKVYELYVRGRYFWNRRTVDGLRKSADYFRQAIDADPNYAPAYAGLADSYALLASFSVEPGSRANADARSAALSAIQLDATLAEPHASLGMIYFFTDWNLPVAEQEFQRTLRLNPNYAMAHHWYALDLAAMARFPQAIYEIRLAQKLDPLSLIINTNVGWIEYLSRDFPAARRDLEQVLELDRNFVRARTRLGMVEMAMGDDRAAVADLTRALELSGDEDPWVEGLLGEAEARAGNRSAAEHTLARICKRSSTHYVPPTSRALILIGLGRKTEALKALSDAVDDHSTSMVYARVDPSLDPMRNDPGFQMLLSRIKP